MKKLILSVAVLAGMTFVACSDDSNDVPQVAYTGGCQICEIPETGPSQVEEQPYEVCVDANGIAYVDNAYTGLQAAYYFELYCANEIDETPNPGTPGNPGEPTDTCVTCAASDMLPTPVEICKGTNGNAIVEGVDMQMPYQQYIDAFETASSTTCE